MKLLRASEIGTYLFCQRAWWYSRQGIESQNLAELAAGQELHERHGRAVLVSSCLQLAAYGLLLTGILLLVAHAITSFLGGG
jgi:CRISPR/Cas system-associated exonuclease Cas4 (RecB family)